jgi:GTP-binding protein LepA
MRYTLPMGEIIFDFFDQLKSRTRGTPRSTTSEAGEQEADLVKVDILLQGEAVDAFSAIVHRDSAYSYGNKMAAKLKELIPRQQFEVPIQAAIGARIIARENIRRSARTCSPSATAVTSAASASCWRSRRKARSG